MDKHIIEKKREEVRSEYNKKQAQAEKQLYELKARKSAVDNCLEDIDSFRIRAKPMLDNHQSELYRHGAHEDLKLFIVVEDGLQQDCRCAANELFDEQEKIESARNEVLKSLEDMESEYRHKLSALEEETRV